VGLLTGVKLNFLEVNSQMTNDMIKTSYVAPALRKEGRVEALTAGNASGANTDAVFPVGTPFGDVTFS
jgi:hypothetical protein